MTNIEKANILTDNIKNSVSDYNKLIYNLTKELKLQDLEIEELKNKLNNLQKQLDFEIDKNDEKQEIIEKAINYIEDESYYIYKDNKFIIDGILSEELLNILKGK